jgi:hypothetical protein
MHGYDEYIKMYLENVPGCDDLERHKSRGGISHHEAGHEITSVTWIQLAEDRAMSLCHYHQSIIIEYSNTYCHQRPLAFSPSLYDLGVYTRFSEIHTAFLLTRFCNLFDI